LIVTQGDTEPASVEQQRLLGHTAPSLYDLRNLFQVNVEEGRHLWAMVYLLHAYFGRDAEWKRSNCFAPLGRRGQIRMQQIHHRPQMPPFFHVHLKQISQIVE